jgi:hypothetical protein
MFHEDKEIFSKKQVAIVTERSLTEFPTEALAT